MEHQSSPGDSPPLSQQALVSLVVFEYRSLVMQRLGVTAEWRGLEWPDEAACINHAEATPQVCARCPVTAQCLAAALTSDDRAEWRGGLGRTDRECLWAGMERTYRDVRDLELMRLDTTRATNRAAAHRSRGHTTNGRHS